MSLLFSQTEEIDYSKLKTYQINYVPLKNDDNVVVKQEIIYKEKPARNIAEIRIFYDDGTYETFTPNK